MGEVRLVGTAEDGYNAQFATANQPATAGTYTLSCAGGKQSAAECAVVVTDASGKVTYNVVSDGTKTFEVADGSKWYCMAQTLAGNKVDATLWPMLTPGDSAKPYSPYVRGGGAS